MRPDYKSMLLLGVMTLMFVGGTSMVASADDEEEETEISVPAKTRKKASRKIIHIQEDQDDDDDDDQDEEDDNVDSKKVVKKPRVTRVRYLLKKPKARVRVQDVVHKEEMHSQTQAFKLFDRYERPQLYFAALAPWRIIYFSPNVSYQGMVPVEGDTNLSAQDKEWCLHLKTKEPTKSCAHLDFLKEVAKKCEDVQVLSCIEHAKKSSWAKEKWKTPQNIMEGIQGIFHMGMEMRVRTFVDRGGKLPWVPTPPWCVNISPKSCSDLAQFDPRTGVNQGGKNFITSAESCNFYEIANCTSEAISSAWAKKRWGNDLHKIAVEINKFIFEKHMERLSKRFPASMAVSEEEARKNEAAQMLSSEFVRTTPSFARERRSAKK